jgi:ribA/ribD-fused uncharacterized protein
LREALTIRGKYALFWHQWPSNWYTSTFALKGRVYCCVEQWMMAEKARLFGDERAEGLILATKDPSKHKRLGKEVKGYVDSKWAAVRYATVLEGVVEKYRQNASLQKLLLDHDYIFVEASPHDTIWGIGLGEDHPDAGTPSKWRGKNLLGKATTEARSILLP